MAKQSLRTLGLAYRYTCCCYIWWFLLAMLFMLLPVAVTSIRDFGSRSELPANWQTSPDTWKAGEARLEDGLVFYGVLGIKDPLRPDVKKAVADCHRAGINVRMYGPSNCGQRMVTGLQQANEHQGANTLCE